jgi:hypothetical protein
MMSRSGRKPTTEVFRDNMSNKRNNQQDGEIKQMEPNNIPHSRALEERSTRHGAAPRIRADKLPSSTNYVGMAVSQLKMTVFRGQLALSTNKRPIHLEACVTDCDTVHSCSRESITFTIIK